MTIKGNLIVIEKIKKKTERELAELSVTGTSWASPQGYVCFLMNLDESQKS